MNTYFVYTNNPTTLEAYGSVYYPRVKMSWVGVETELEKYEVCNIEGVYEVREAEEGEFNV